jgi:exopolyphosphatase / guanosine-5'-triphosphate,3'-diphosphate pyrophosphatase
MKIGVIDLGSNTIRLVIYSWNGKNLEKIHNIKRYAQSIKFVHSNKMNRDGMEVIALTLKELIMIARVHDTKQLSIFATASLRNIENSQKTKEYLEQSIQYPIDVLDGTHESLYGFEGMKITTSLPLEGLCIDIGGGSTELTYFKDNIAIHMISIPIGSLNLSLKCVANVLPSDAEEMKMRLIIRDQINTIEWLSHAELKNVIGIGGSVRAIMKLKRALNHSKESIYAMQILPQDLQDINLSVIKNPLGLTKLILQVVPDRLQTVITGSIIIEEIMRRVNAEQLVVSSFGLREGYLISRVLNAGGSYE